MSATNQIKNSFVVSSFIYVMVIYYQKTA